MSCITALDPGMLRMYTVSDEKDERVANASSQSMEWRWSTHPLKLTAKAPKNGWFQYYFPIGKAYFQVPC